MRTSVILTKLKRVLPKYSRAELLDLLDEVHSIVYNSDTSQTHTSAVISAPPRLQTHGWIATPTAAVCVRIGMKNHSIASFWAKTSCTYPRSPKALPDRCDGIPLPPGWL